VRKEKGADRGSADGRVSIYQDQYHPGVLIPEAAGGARERGESDDDAFVTAAGAGVVPRTRLFAKGRFSGGMPAEAAKAPRSVRLTT